MVKEKGEEEVLIYTPMLKGSDAKAEKTERHRFSPYKFVLFGHNLIAVGLALAMGVWMSGFNVPMEIHPWQAALPMFSLITIAFFPTYGLYSYHLIFSKRYHLLNLFKAFGWGLVTLSIAMFIWAYSHLLEGPAAIPLICMASIGLLLFSRVLSEYLLNIMSSVGISFLAIGTFQLMDLGQRSIFVGHWAVMPLGFLFAIGAVPLSRSLLVHVIFNGWIRRYFRTQVAIVGSDQEAKAITNHVVAHNAPFWVAGFVSALEVRSLDLRAPKARLGELKDLPQIVKERKIDEIIVTDKGIDKRTLISLLDYCTSEGVSVWFSPKLMPIINMKLQIDTFCGLPMIRLFSQKNRYFFNNLKHGFDAFAVVPMLLLLLPLFLVIGIAVKINSRGPVFYKAKAVGRNGQPFSLYKFRSMYADTDCEIHKAYTEKLIKGEMSDQSGTGGVFKMTEHPRITSIGRILRKFSLDELPQLINVLKGEMSLVGPRPCLPYEYEAYKDWHKKRLSIRPGITGIWQVAGRSAVSFEDMVLFDLYYVYNRSLLIDMNILYETIFVVLGKKGAY